MRPKHILQFILIFFVMLPAISAASNWIQFGVSNQNGASWHYDNDSIVYFQDKKIIGIDVPIKDRNYQRMWIKSSGGDGEKRYRVELNCKERSARLQDDGGKNLYSEPSMDYLYDKPIAPDTVLDMLCKKVCK
jgi:hypothetical protein